MRLSAKKNISAGSMADIAFLLLIFFLISTTIEVDQGIVVKLPPIDDNNTPPQPPSRNILSVLINADNQILVRGESTLIDDLTRKTKEFIMNPTGRAELAKKPSMAIVSLKNDRATRYGTYISVYNELKAAYNQLWDEECRATFGMPYSQALPRDIRAKIKRKIPFVISEAEPTDFRK